MSVAKTRKKVIFPLGRSDSVLIVEFEPGMVSPGLVLEGLIRARSAAMAIGCSAWHTLELKGPTTPTTVASPASAVMLAAPWFGSCLPSATDASSLSISVKVHVPPSRWLALAWVTASCAPWRVGMPSVASPPVGRSVATVTVPVHAAPPPLLLAGALLVPQAASAPMAAIDAIDKNPLVGLTMCWVLLSLRGIAGEALCVHSGSDRLVNRPLERAASETCRAAPSKEPLNLARILVHGLRRRCEWAECSVCCGRLPQVPCEAGVLPSRPGPSASSSLRAPPRSRRPARPAAGRRSRSGASTCSAACSASSTSPSARSSCSRRARVAWACAIVLGVDHGRARGRRRRDPRRRREARHRQGRAR